MTEHQQHYLPAQHRQGPLDGGSHAEVIPEEAPEVAKSPGLGVTGKFPSAEVYTDEATEQGTDL